MKKIQNTLILAFALAFVFMHSCKEAETVSPDPVDTTTTGAKATYALDAAPVFNASCATSGCHTAGAGIGSLASYDNAKAFTQGGKVLKAMKHQSGAKAMPQGSPKLADDKIAKIEAWINDGYLP